MQNMEWPANDYAIGSYIQATVADHYLPDLSLRPTDSVLDIGCGNGSYSLKIIDKIPQGNFWGIDASANMIALAKETIQNHSKVVLQQTDVINMNFNSQFEQVVSFWCLQWCNNIKTAFENIYLALKPGGRVMTLFPSGDDPFITSFTSVLQSGQFPQLKDFKSPVDYSQLHDLKNKIVAIPYKNLVIKRDKQTITLPTLDVFRKFVKGIAFYQGQIPADEITLINEAMVEVFAEQCRLNYGGKFQFDFSVYYVTAEK